MSKDKDKKDKAKLERGDKRDERKAFTLEKLREKTALMVAKAKRWKWLAIVLGLLAVIGMTVLSKLGWLGSLFGK
jgi:cell division septal protein FtsQ